MGRSEVAGAVAHGLLGKRECARLSGLFAGEGAALLAASGDAAVVIFVFFAVDPLEEDIEQEVTAENAECEEHSERHGGLTRASVNG